MSLMVPIVVAAATTVNLLPATGIAVGIYVAVALACLLSGGLLRWKANRMERRTR